MATKIGPCTIKMPEPGNEKSAQEGSGPEAPAAGGDGDGGAGGVPDGVVPLFLTGAGQKIFQCVADTDVTPEAPHKIIPKNSILEDFRNRAAVSDFHPVKKKVQVSVFLYNAHHQYPHINKVASSGMDNTCGRHR